MRIHARPDRLTSSTAFPRFRTNQLWVADFTYVWTWSGIFYVAFVFDVHSRRIISWRAATSMTTPLVLDCLEMALWTRRREGVAGFTGLTHHTGAGSVYTSIAFTDRLVDEGIDPPSAASATPTTTRSRSRRLASTSPSSSTTKPPGETSTRSRPPRLRGCSGSTQSAPAGRSTTSHPSRPSSSTAL
jgi:hypothetical protein